MGGLREFQIYFDNPIATYYGGQVVSGRIVVKLDKEKKMRGIEVRFRGQADVEWMESKTIRVQGKSHTVHETFTGHERYFESRKYIVGSSSGDMVLPVGEHVFPISTTLPNNLPSSFEGSDGNVRYTVKATMDRPWKFDHEVKAAFTVVQHLDLNAEQGLKEPVQVTKEKFLYCCCCKSGPITMVATVPITGYVPGQDIPITVEIDNTTKQTVKNVSCRLIKIVNFHAGSTFRDKTRTDESEVAEECTNEVVGHLGSGCWTVKIKVPALAPSYLKYCNIIDVEYKVSIKGIIAGAHSNMKREIPIVLGTIPLMTYFPHINPASAPVPPPGSDFFGGGAGEGFQPNVGWNPPGQYPPNGDLGSYSPMGDSSPYPSKKESSDPYSTTGGPYPYPPTGAHAPFGSVGPSASTAPSAPYDPHPLYPEMPPPSYAECMLGKKDIKDSEDNEHIQGDMGFAPRYPMYQFND